MRPFSAGKRYSPRNTDFEHFWKKMGIAVLVTAILWLWTTAFLEKLVQYQSLSLEWAKLDEERRFLEETVQSLQEEKEYLTQDWYIEKKAREELSLAKPGEIVVKVIKPEKIPAEK